MRIDHDHGADALYLHVRDGTAGPVTSTVELPSPEGVAGMVLVDFVGSEMVGIEIVGVSNVAPDLAG